MSLNKYLKNKLKKEMTTYYSNNISDDYINKLSKAWLNDSSHPSSINRLAVIKKFSPHTNRILDMAGGCGTFYFHGLINGYDMYAIEPEDWKNSLIKMKIKENNYPKHWANNFQSGYGEKLPYKNNCFDFVTSYQTLEHVSDIENCIKEMIRVTKKGGFIHIQCPDFNSTFEGHYKLPWLSVFSKFPLIAKGYLKFLNRPIKGLETINYITLKKIYDILNINYDNNILIIDLKKEKFIKKYRINYFYQFYRLIKNIKIIFRKEFSVNIIIEKK